MSINKAKSVVMTFDGPGASSVQQTLEIMVGGEHLQQVQSFKYLGIEFHHKHWLKNVCTTRAQATTRAIWALWRGVQIKKVICRDIMLRLYRAQVLPIGLYGARVKYTICHWHTQMAP